MEFLDNVKNLGGFKFENLTDIFKNFKDTVIDYFMNFEGFDALKNALSTMWSDVKARLAEYGIDLDGWKQKITEFFGTITETLSGFKLPASVDEIPQFFGGLKEVFSGLFEDFDLGESFKNIFGETAEAVELSGDLSGDLDETDKNTQTFKEKLTKIFETIGSIAKVIAENAKPIIIGVIAIKSILTGFSLISSVIRLIKSIAKDKEGSALMKKGFGILLMAAALAVLVKAVKSLSELDFVSLAKGIGGLVIIGVVLGALIKVAGTAQSSALPLFGVAAVILAISLSLAGLSFIKRTKLEHVKSILIDVIEWASILAKASGQLSSGLSGGTAMIGLALTIAAIGASLAGLTFVDQDNLDHVKEVLIDVMEWASILAGDVGALKPAWESLLAMAGIIAVAGGVILALSFIPISEDLIKKVDMLSEVILSLSAAAALIGLVGYLGGAASMTSGLAALGEMAGVFTVLTGFMAAVDEFTKFITEKINGEGKGIGLEDMWETWLEPMFDLLDKLGAAIGRVIGNILGGLLGGTLEGAASALPSIGEFLVAFADVITGLPEEGSVDFGMLNKLIDEIGKVSWEGLKIGVENAIAQGLTGMNTADNFAQALGGVIGCINVWNEKLGGKNGEGLKIAKLDRDAFDEMVLAVKDVSKAGFIGAIESFIGNVLSEGDDKTSVERFSEASQTLAEAIIYWNTAMESVETITVPKGIDAIITTIGEIQTRDLFNALIGMFVFDDMKDWDPVGDFQDNTIKLATALLYFKTFTEQLGDDYAIDSELVNQNIQALQDAFDEIDDGIWKALGESLASIFGADTSSQIEAFKTNATNLGEGLKNFADAIGEGLDTDTFAEITSAVKDLGEGISGISSISTAGFGDNFERVNSLFGAITTGFATLTGVNGEATIDVTKLTNISTAADLLSQGVDALSKVDLDAGDISDETIVSDFVSAIGEIKVAIESLSTMDTSGVDKLNAATESLSETNLSQLNADASSAGTDAMNSLGSSISDSSSGVTTAVGNVVSSAIDVMRNSRDSFGTQGRLSIDRFRRGMLDVQDSVNRAAETIANGAKSALGIAVGPAGENFAYGFAAGIQLRTYVAVEAARAMAQAAIDKIKQVTKEHSPSKVTEGLGMFFGGGFEIGIIKKTHDVASASADLGNAATDGLNNAINGISSVLTSDIDSNPVIRPVLDLSEIQNGAGLIGNMLNINEPIAVTGAMSDINYNTRYRSPNDDILSAINSLGKTLGNGGGDTYVVNGVTYDDGSNVSGAVRDLIRAANISKRV